MTMHMRRDIQTIIISNKHVIYIVFLMNVLVTKNISSVCVLLRF